MITRTIILSVSVFNATFTSNEKRNQNILAHVVSIAQE